MPNYTPYNRNKCPHCLTVVKFEESEISTPRFNDDHAQYRVIRTGSPKEEWYIIPSFCPNCLQTIITLLPIKILPEVGEIAGKAIVLWPLSSGRPPAPDQVPENIAQDYNESALVLPFSPKASAALSRRCLQAILSEAAGTKSKSLSKQIDEILPKLPSYIAENLDAVRNIGNFAAHEQKSTMTNLILEVEPGEAEWNLEVIEALFDFYYVRPEIEKRKRDELNKKLADAGKPPLKEP